MSVDGGTSGQGEKAILRARAQRLARQAQEDTAVATVEVIPLTAGGLRYAVPTKTVRQVRRLTGIARVPRAPLSLLGVTRIRSTVVPVFDLAVLLDVATDAAEAGEWVVVLGDGDRPELGIAAEAVDGIREVPRDEIVEPSGGAHTNVGIWGVTVDGVTVLDVHTLLDLPPLFGGAHPQTAASAAGDGADSVTIQRGQA